MPRVICANNMCVYNDEFEGVCKYDGTIYAEEECLRFQSYRDEQDYQDEYWMACENNSVKYRTRHFGKRIDVMGLTLYTQDRLPPEDVRNDPMAGIHCTEKETGMGLSLHNVFDPKAREVILEYIRKMPNVMSLPEKQQEEWYATD